MTDGAPGPTVERPDERAGGLAEAIRLRLGECSPAERKVGRVLLASYPSAGFETVARLALRAGVSGPTVIRFVNRLGFSGFPDFQRALREDLDDRTASPLSLYDSTGFADHAHEEASALLERARGVAVRSMERTFTAIPPHDLRRAVELLAQRRGRVLLVGGRFSHLLARYLGQHLEQLRDGVTVVPDLPAPRAAALAELGAHDVVVVFDYRRYEESSLALARYATTRHAAVVLFTDVFLSPVAALAAAVLPSETGAPSPYDAMAPALAVVEAVIAGVLGELGEEAHERMRRTEQAAGDLSLY